MNSKGFKQLIKHPTHSNGGILDLIFLPTSFCVNNLQVLKEKAISDHFPIFFDISLFTNKLPLHFQKQYRNISLINEKLFKHNITRHVVEISKHNLESEHCLNQALLDLHSQLSIEINKQAPLVTKTLRVTSQVIRTKEIQEARRLKRRAESAFKKFRSENNRDSLKNAKKCLAKIVKNTRIQYFKDKFDKYKNDVRKTYGVINSLLNKNNDKVFPSHADAKVLANKFADFYNEKIEKIRSTLTETSQPTVYLKKMNIVDLSEFTIVSNEEVLTILESLNSNKQSILDPIPCKLLKECKMELLPLLVKTINCSFKMGHFPSHLKTAIVTPVIKSTNLDCELLNNYRPISNLNLISKIFEKSVLKQLNEHLNRNNLYCRYQSAYRQGHSCETALVKIYNDIINYLSPTTYVILVFLDFSAAFDTIDHNILINRLSSDYGIKDKALKWFESYLNNREYRVKVNNTVSDERSLNYGVPQGSILGPILFSLYIKEINTIAHSHNINVHFYADDVLLYMKCNNDTDFTNLENCLKRIKSWTDSNYLKLNNSKTKFLAVSTKYYKLNKVKELNIMGERFTVENSVKYLGFFLDENLNMEKQINKVCSVGYGMLRNLWKISRKVTDKKLRTQLVHSSILSRINYCNSLYAFIPKSFTHKLQKLVNASARFIFNITGKDRLNHITPYLKELHFLPIQHRIKFKVCLLVYKCLNTDSLAVCSPPYLTEMLDNKEPNKKWNLRMDSDKFLLAYGPLERLSFKDRGFSHAAPIIWNKLPLSVRESKTVDSFKINLKTHYFKQWSDV